MSRYLVDRIAALANVEVLTQHRGHGLEGKDGGSRRSAGGIGGASSAAPIQHLFLFIGADPNTDLARGIGRGARR